MMEKVSAYTPAFNAQETLAASIESLRASEHPFWEILTVHDGGNVEAWDVAESLDIPILPDHNGKNLGLAASCNTALKHCTGDFLAKIDSDVELSPFWLDKVVPHFRDEKVAGVGGRLVETFASTVPGKWRSRFMPQHHGPALVTNPSGLFGADCVFRVSALRAVGGWNARYRTNFEDMDLSRRLMDAGFLLVYEPHAVCRHLRQDTLADVLGNFWRWYKDAPEDKGFYSGFEQAAQLIQRNAALATNQIAQAMNEGQFDLVYPSLLLFFRMCFEDLQHLAKKGSVPREAAIATILAVGSSSREAFRSRFPEVIADRLEADMGPELGGTDWEPDSVYLGAFRGSLAAMQIGPMGRWALETSIAALGEVPCGC